MVDGRQSALLAVGIFVTACRATGSEGIQRAEAGSKLEAPSTSASAPPPASTASTPPASESADGARGLEPLTAVAPMIALEVPGFESAAVAVPLGATEPRPVLIATHGNFDRPEWQCQVWSEATRGKAFVLCPRGQSRRDVPKREDRWTYVSLKGFESELMAATAALGERFGAHVAVGPPVLLGFSLGAIFGAQLARARPEAFPRLVLIEGGYKGWSASGAKAYSEGGQRVLFVCAQSVCPPQARAPQKWLEAAGVAARIADAGNIGHTYDGPVARAVQENLAWLLEGLNEWSPVLPPDPN